MKKYQKYEFYGHVTDRFSRILCRGWHATTYAPSVAKARSNLTYQFKKSFGLTATAAIQLSGNFVPTVSRFTV